MTSENNDEYPHETSSQSQMEKGRVICAETYADNPTFSPERWQAHELPL